MSKLRDSISFLIVILLFMLPVNSFGMDHGDAEIDCIIDKAPCIRVIESRNIQISFDINPKPVTPMTELAFRVDITSSGKPVTDAEISLDLTMPGMFMGINRPIIKHVKDGTYEGKGVIPVCKHGGKIWKAEITISQKREPASVSYVFEVK